MSVDDTIPPDSGREDASGPRFIGHLPKRAAIEAYADDLLSDEGTRRFERHLAVCEVCRRALAERRSYDELAREAREQPPTIDWDTSGISLSLGREAVRLAEESRQASRGAEVVPLWRRPATLVAFGLAAAVLLALKFRPAAPAEPVARQEDPVPSTTHAPAPPSDIEYLPGVVVAEVRLDGDAPPFALGAEFSEGDPIDATRRERHLSFGARANLRLVDAEATLDHARVADRDEDGLSRADLRLALTRGAVGVGLPREALERGTTRVMISAAGYHFRAEATLFEVWLDERQVGLRLGEGHARVTRGDSGEFTELQGPGEWTAPRAAAEAFARVISEPQAPRAPLSVSVEGVRLDLPASRFSAGGWQVAGTRLAAGPVALSLPPGLHELTAFDRTGRAQRIELELLPETPLAANDILARLRAGRAGSLSAEEIQSVVAPSRRQLTRCYQLALRRNPDLGAHQLRMRVRVTPQGRVGRVRVLGSDDLPADLQGCLRRVGSAWRFPDPDGSLTFELPLDLRAR